MPKKKPKTAGAMQNLLKLFKPLVEPENPDVDTLKKANDERDKKEKDKKKAQKQARVIAKSLAENARDRNTFYKRYE